MHIAERANRILLDHARTILHNFDQGDAAAAMNAAYQMYRSIRYDEMFPTMRFETHAGIMTAGDLAYKAGEFRDPEALKNLIPMLHAMTNQIPKVIKGEDPFDKPAKPAPQPEAKAPEPAPLPAPAPEPVQQPDPIAAQPAQLPVGAMALLQKALALPEEGSRKGRGDAVDRLIKTLLIADPNTADDTIAEAVGVDRSRVVKVRAKLLND